MSKTTSPTIPALPADIVSHANLLDLTAETYAHVVAGHGVTGRVEWSVYHVNPATSAKVRMRYGTALDAAAAHVHLRKALHDLSIARAQTALEGEVR